MLKPVHSTVSMIMDRAYEGGETRQLVLELGFTPVVPPKQGRDIGESRSLYHDTIERGASTSCPYPARSVVARPQGTGEGFRRRCP